MALVESEAHVEVQVFPWGESDVLALRGDLDLAAGLPVRAVLDSLFAAGGRPVIVDLSAVDFIDSSGLQLLLEARSVLLERGHQVRFRGVSDAAGRLFETFGLSDLFDLRR